MAQLVSIPKYMYMYNLVFVSVYINNVPIQFKFDMLYIGTETEMKNYEEKV